jgi:uroporphyrinogen decarboxylase
MRQAGRYLPEYRAVRARVPGFLDLCYAPELAVEVTLQPVRRFAVDGAILFSDILVVPDGLGVEVAFVEGRGPVLEPLSGPRSIEALDLARMRDHLEPVYETVGRISRELPDEVVLLGFAGAPWTLAAYMIEGETSRDFTSARRLARSDPALFQRLIDLLTEAVVVHLDAQIAAGAQAVQLFDSWAGILASGQFERWSVRPLSTIARRLKERHPEVPVIAFPRAAGANLRSFKGEHGIDALGLDQMMPLNWARDGLEVRCLQGNLDPMALAVGGQAMLEEADLILTAMAGRPFVFNLGHGVLPETDPEQVKRLVDHVRQGRDAP